MDTVRIARDLGDVSTLLPEGVPLSDAPYNLVNAFNISLRFLHWQDELDADEMPPKRIWLEPEALKVHFEWIAKKRKAKYSGKDDDIDSPIEGPTMEQDAASMLIAD